MSVRRLAVARHLGWLLGISVVSSATAQTTPAEVRAQRILDSARTSIELATAAGDVNAIHGIQVLLERALAVAPSDPWLLHYLGYATYREATLRMEGSRNDNATLLQRADSIIQLSLSFKDISESYALHSSLLGLMIGSSPLRAMTNGPKSGAAMQRALELAPNNPRVWLQRGIGALNTPPMFGGGVDKAEEYLKKAVELFANDHPQAPEPMWGSAEAFAWLGRVYANQGKSDSARASYDRALTIEPNNRWVRDVLLRALNHRS